jgi:hypothetical protein
MQHRFVSALEVVCLLINYGLAVTNVVIYLTAAKPDGINLFAAVFCAVIGYLTYRQFETYRTRGR